MPSMSAHMLSYAAYAHPYALLCRFMLSMIFYASYHPLTHIDIIFAFQNAFSTLFRFLWLFIALLILYGPPQPLSSRRLAFQSPGGPCYFAVSLFIEFFISFDICAFIHFAAIHTPFLVPHGTPFVFHVV